MLFLLVFYYINLLLRKNATGLKHPKLRITAPASDYSCLEAAQWNDLQQQVLRTPAPYMHALSSVLGLLINPFSECCVPPNCPAV